MTSKLKHNILLNSIIYIDLIIYYIILHIFNIFISSLKAYANYSKKINKINFYLLFNHFINKLN